MKNSKAERKKIYLVSPFSHLLPHPAKDRSAIISRREGGQRMMLLSARDLSQMESVINFSLFHEYVSSLGQRLRGSMSLLIIINGHFKWSQDCNANGDSKFRA